MKQRSKSYSFLIEMLIVILFFSLAVIVSMQLFVKAWEKSLESRAANYALTQVESLMEEQRSQFKTRNRQADWEDLQGVEPIVQYYNKQWEKTDGKQNYAVQVITEIESRDEAGVLLKLTAQAAYTDAGRKGKEILSLTTSQYISFREAGVEVAE